MPIKSILLCILTVTCYFKASATITISAQTTNATCRYDNGIMILTASGGVAPYTYSVTNNAYYYKKITSKVSPVFANLPGDWYFVSAVDLIGDTATTMVFVSDKYEPFDYTVSINARPYCTDSTGMFTVYASNGLAPYLYSINGGLNYQTSNVFNKLPVGYYTVFVKDANGCVIAPWWSKQAGSYLNFVSWGQIFGYYLTGTCDLSFSVRYPAPGCGNYVTMQPFLASGGTPPYTFSLDGGAFATLPINFTYTGLTPGRHYITMKDAIGATTNVSMDFASNCFATKTSGTPCGQANGTITVTAANGIRPVTYSIDGKNFQNDSVFTNLMGGTYSVIVKDVNGATVTGDAIVTDNCPAVTAVALPDTCTQNVASIIVTGTKGTPPYLFSIDGVNFQASNIFKGLAAGSYIVTIKDANGFSDFAGAVIKNYCLQVSLTSTKTTCGNNKGSITATGTNGTPPYQYAINGTSFQSANTFTGLIAGNYIVTIKDAIGALGSSTITVADAPAPQLNVLFKQPGCNNTGGSITITKSGGAAPFLYSINGGTTFQTDSVFNNLIAKQYFINVKDGNGCIARDTLQLFFPSSPNVFLGNDTTTCEGNTVVLYATRATGFTYEWQDMTTVSQYAVSKTGAYSVKVTNANGCSTADTIMVSFTPLPMFTLGNDTSLCNGHVLNLKPVLPSGIYLWNTGSTGPTIQISKSGSYWLKVSDGGCSNSDTLTATYNPNPVVDLGRDITICLGQTILLNAQNTGATYLWQDGSTAPAYLVSKQGVYGVTVRSLNGCDTSGKVSVLQNNKPMVYLGKDTTLCQTETLVLNAANFQSSYKWQDGSTSPDYRVTQAGIFNVQVTNDCGSVQDTININYENCACQFYIPSAFTPNADGKNDIFQPRYKCLLSNYTIKIYNRFGQTIFVSNNPDTGWDGTVNGQGQPMGSYVWDIRYTDDLTGKQIHKEGLITLIR